MTTPINQSFICFGCHQSKDKIFVKIYESDSKFVCSLKCLTVALEVLGIDGSKVEVNPRPLKRKRHNDPPSQVTSPTRPPVTSPTPLSPLRRSPGKLNLTKISDSSSGSL